MRPLCSESWILFFWDTRISEFCTASWVLSSRILLFSFMTIWLLFSFSSWMIDLFSVSRSLQVNREELLYHSLVDLYFVLVVLFPLCDLSFLRIACLLDVLLQDLVLTLQQSVLLFLVFDLLLVLLNNLIFLFLVSDSADIGLQLTFLLSYIQLQLFTFIVFLLQHLVHLVVLVLILHTVGFYSVQVQQQLLELNLSVSYFLVQLIDVLVFL